MMFLKGVVIGLLVGLMFWLLLGLAHAAPLTVTQAQSHGAYPRTGFGLQARQSTVWKVQDAYNDDLQ